jgi:hypothetical protein
MNKLTMTAAGVLAGMVVGGTVGMVLGGKRETRRVMRKTRKAAHAIGDILPKNSVKL